MIYPLSLSLSRRERERNDQAPSVIHIIPAKPTTTPDHPLSPRDAYRDAGGRATHGAVAERAGER